MYDMIVVKEVDTNSQTLAPQNGTKIVRHSVNKLLKLKVAFGIIGRSKNAARFPEHYKKIENRKSLHSNVKFMLLSSAHIVHCIYMCVWMKAAFRCCSLPSFNFGSFCYILCRIASISFWMSTWCPNSNVHQPNTMPKFNSTTHRNTSHTHTHTHTMNECTHRNAYLYIQKSELQCILMQCLLIFNAGFCNNMDPVCMETMQLILLCIVSPNNSKIVSISKIQSNKLRYAMLCNAMQCIALN